MVLTSHPYQSEFDFPKILPLLQQMPENSYHLIDLPWRLSAPNIQMGLDAQIWHTPDGTVVGFAAWQHYWAMLDYFVHPDYKQTHVEQAIFSWAIERFRELDQERGKPLPYWVQTRADDSERLALLQAQGFDLDEDYNYIRLVHSLTKAQPDTMLPEGFTIRPLAGLAEVEAYAALHRAAFQSTSMTAEWRARTLRTPTYQPDLDIVAVAPDGSLAGFCVGWFDQVHTIGQIEPLGIHPDYQRQGLDRALLGEILRRFQNHHARYIIVETENVRDSAVSTYESIGFHPAYPILLKGRWVTSEG